MRARLTTRTRRRHSLSIEAGIASAMKRLNLVGVTTYADATATFLADSA
jgi:hypothetical protein